MNKIDITKIKDEIRRITLGLGREDVLAVGLLGSLARGDFNERSDIDIFVITRDPLSLEEQHRFYHEYHELIGLFHRDITVLVYDIKDLKSVPSWQTLNMVRDAQFVYDRAEIQKLFKRILKEAEAHGIIYDEKEKVFRLKKPGRVVFSLKD
jgi:predicted nucleotidyltransferase